MEEKKDIFDFIEKRPSETPDSDYFDNLAASVISEVSNTDNAESDASKGKVVPLYRRPALWLSGAAAAILVAFLLLPEQTAPTSEGALSFEDLSKKEVLAYVDENIEDFDVELLAEFIPSNKLSTDNYFDQTTQEVPEEVETTNPELEESLESVSPQEILEYLEMEGMDVDDLDEELFL